MLRTQAKEHIQRSADHAPWQTNSSVLTPPDTASCRIAYCTGAAKRYQSSPSSGRCVPARSKGGGILGLNVGDRTALPNADVDLAKGRLKPGIVVAQDRRRGRGAEEFRGHRQVRRKGRHHRGRALPLVPGQALTGGTPASILS